MENLAAARRRDHGGEQRIVRCTASYRVRQELRLEPHRREGGICKLLCRQREPQHSNDAPIDASLWRNSEHPVSEAWCIEENSERCQLQIGHTVERRLQCR